MAAAAAGGARADTGRRMGIKVKQEAAMDEIEEEREDGEGREGG